MSSDRYPRPAPCNPPPPIGRAIRWSQRFNTYQVGTRYNGVVVYRNIRPELVRCYAAAGLEWAE